MIKINTRNVNDISIIDFEGDITIISAELECESNSFINQDKIKIVINFQALDYISSGGLRALLSTANILKAKNGNSRLCNLNPNVHKIFKLAGPTTIFNIYETKRGNKKFLNFIYHGCGFYLWVKIAKAVIRFVHFSYLHPDKLRC